MAKTVCDLVEISHVIAQAATSPMKLELDPDCGWDTIKIGFVDLDKWRLPDHLFTSTAEYKAQIVSLGHLRYWLDNIPTMLQDYSISRSRSSDESIQR